MEYSTTVGTSSMAPAGHLVVVVTINQQSSLQAREIAKAVVGAV